MPAEVSFWVLVAVGALILPVMIAWAFLFERLRKTGTASPWFWVLSAAALVLAAAGALVVQFR